MRPRPLATVRLAPRVQTRRHDSQQVVTGVARISWWAACTCSVKYSMAITRQGRDASAVVRATTQPVLMIESAPHGSRLQDMEPSYCSNLATVRKCSLHLVVTATEYQLPIVEVVIVEDITKVRVRLALASFALLLTRPRTFFTSAHRMARSTRP